MSRKILLPALLLTGAFLWAAFPGQSTHYYENTSIELKDQTIDNLRAVNMQNVTLRNVTISGSLQIEGAQKVRLTDVTVGTDYLLKGANEARHERVKVTNTFTLNNTKNGQFSADTYDSPVWILNSEGLVWQNATFKSTVCTHNSTNLTFQNAGSAGPSITSCPGYGSSATTAPTGTYTYTTYPTSDYTYTSYSSYTYTYSYETYPYPSPTACPAVRTSAYTDAAGNKYENTYTEYPYGCPPPTYTIQPTYPTEYPYPYPTKYDAAPTNKNYRFELVSKDVYQDLWIYSAEQVVIRDATIYGNLGIGWSANVELHNVQITGMVTIDQSSNLRADGLVVGGMAGLSYVTNFLFAASSVGGHLGCYQCLHGVFEDVHVAGEVMIKESTDVEQIAIESRGEVTWTPTAPMSTPSLGVVALNVENSNLEFVHRKDVDARFATAVKVGVDALKAVAKLEVATEHGDDVAIELESAFEKLVEFEDRNGDGAYDTSDLVLREYLIDELEISGIEQERLPANDGWRGRVDYELPRGGRLGLIFTTKDGADADNTKIDIELFDYAYTTRSSQLALQVRLASASDWNITAKGDEDVLRFFGKGLDGYFGWVNWATVDGVQRDVTARVLEEHKTEGGEREIVLLLAYPHGDAIVHDPSIGVLESASIGGIEIPALGDLVVYGTTLVAVIVVLWALGEGTRRRTT